VLKVFVRFLVPEDPLGDLEDPSELHQGKGAGAERRLEAFIADPAESKCAESGLVGNAEEIIAFHEGANGAAFAFGEPALGTLHQAAPPGVRR
jgi:hypothetical protein